MSTDCLIIGSGIAGLSSALKLSNKLNKIYLISKTPISETSSYLAQGGMVAILNQKDSTRLHVQDTMRAGSFHNNKKTVKAVSKKSAESVLWLEGKGIRFDKNEHGKYDFAHEAAHSVPRVLHIRDFTGKSIVDCLYKKAKAKKNIIIYNDMQCLKLLVKKNSCIGADFYDKFNNKKTQIYCQNTILASGGIGNLYKWTTNPAGSTAEIIAIANSAGAEIADMEFVQFHPTAFKADLHPSFLLSESLRGDGAYITDRKGNRIVSDLENAELTARDIIASRLYELSISGQDAFLDFRHKSKKYLRSRFPTIFKKLLSHGYDLSRDLIPIVPAAHYLCGGIKTDLYARTSLSHLYAIGECACTGMHGANRLASNSLLEAVVMGLQCAEKIGEDTRKYNTGQIQRQNVSICNRTNCKQLIETHIKKIQQIMWQYAGILRTDKSLLQGYEKITHLQNSVDRLFLKNTESVCYVGICNILTAAGLIIKSALKRKKTLGCHRRID